MRTLVLAGAVAGLLMECTCGIQAQDQAAAAVRPVCPVTGHPVNAALAATWQGGTVCFCSQDCLNKFLASPGKYAVKANYQLAVTGQAKQVACPFTGKPLSPNIAPMNVGGLSIGFCCRACQQTVARADDQTRIELVFGDAFRTGFVMNQRR